MTAKKITDSEGRRRLVEVVAEGTSQTAIAARLKALGTGATQAAVSFWCSGKTRPPAFLRVVLHRLYSIPQEAWLTPAEQALVATLPHAPADEPEDLLAWAPLHSTKTPNN